MTCTICDKECQGFLGIDMDDVVGIGYCPDHEEQAKIVFSMALGGEEGLIDDYLRNEREQAKR